MPTTKVLHYVWRTDGAKLTLENAQCIDAVSLDVGDITLYLNHHQVMKLWTLIGCYLATGQTGERGERSCSP